MPPTNTPAVNPVPSPPKAIDQVIQKSPPPSQHAKSAAPKPVTKKSGNGVGLVIAVAVIVVIALCGLAYYAYLKSTK